MVRRLTYDGREGWIDISEDLYDSAVAMAIEEGMTVEAAIQTVLSEEVESVEKK